MAAELERWFLVEADRNRYVFHLPSGAAIRFDFGEIKNPALRRQAILSVNRLAGAISESSFLQGVYEAVSGRELVYKDFQHAELVA